MNLIIRNSNNGRETSYAPSELTREARLLARKEKGKLLRHYLHITEGRTGQAVCLRVDIQLPTGVSVMRSQAL